MVSLPLRTTTTISHSHDPFVATIANFVAQIWHGYVMLITHIGEVQHICQRY